MTLSNYSGTGEEAIAAFREAMRSAGLHPPEEVVADGALHRFASNGRRGKNAGWYTLHLDGVPAGNFGCHRAGVNQNWSATPERTMSTAEKSAYKVRMANSAKARDADRAKRHAEATTEAARIWEAAKPATDAHPYLARKGVRAHGLRQETNGRLVVPVRVGKVLRSLQFIDEDGGKIFLAGGEVTGGYYSIETTSDATALCVVEGFATGATVHEETGYPVAVAFNAGNLIAVVKAMHERYPDLSLIICGDDDPQVEGNPGRSKATEAARSVGARLALPGGLDDITDFNDLAQRYGLGTVSAAVDAARICEPPAEVQEEAAAEEWPVVPDEAAYYGGSDPAGSAPTQLLDAAGLRDLDGKSIDEIVAFLCRVAERLKAANGDALLHAAVRDEAIARLKSAKVVSSPTNLVDSALKGLTAESEEDDRQGQALELTDPEPWPEPVDGTELLSELHDVVKRYVVLTKGGATTTALWGVNSYVHDAAEIPPYLGIVSPDKRCGKTTLLTVLGQLVLRPVPASNISSASLFRAVEKFRPTLIIDEAETFLKEKEELRGILNAGHGRSNAFVVRTVGDNHEPRLFSTWCPKAFALIGRLPETLEDRSIIISMHRRAPGEHVERLRIDRLDLGDLRRRIARWASDHLEELRNSDPATPNGLSDRARDNWRPLLAIADLVGGEWPNRARKAAEALSESSQGSDDAGSARSMLLQDLQSLFQTAERLSSEEIVEALVQMEDRPWPEWQRGQPITQRGVAKLLQPFGVGPKQFWLENQKRRGYEKAEFKDVWERYLDPKSPETPVTSGRTGINVGGQQVTPDSQVVGSDDPTGC